MKHLALLVLSLFTFSLTAQVEIDQAIELTGTDGDRAVRNLEAPVDGTDAVNKDYVDNAVSGSGGGLSLPTMMSDQSASTMNYVPALMYCKNLSEGGYSDWRMPTFGEMTYMLSQGGITIPNVTNNANVWFRDPIAYGSTSFARWALNFGSGVLSAASWSGTGDSYFARCVR